MGFHLSVLQGEPPVVKTLLKANALARLMKQDAGFKLRFGQMDLQGAGILVVTDASLGNVTRASGADGPLYTKVFNQAAYLVLVAERNLMSGKQGRFGVLDARSHRLTRVCRSTYGAELLGLKESLDIGFFSRGLLAEVQGFSVLKGDEQYNSFIPLGLVTDAKDVYDKNTSDTPTYGSQKSLAFTVAWTREVSPSQRQNADPLDFDRKYADRLRYKRDEVKPSQSSAAPRHMEHYIQPSVCQANHKAFEGCCSKGTFSPRSTPER